ncbi:MAG: methyltransferase domain-containing protein [Proteobacteria bacterium]|nr:methyltransferase domain-containing protein [Pseudomonadota bacterium]
MDRLYRSQRHIYDVTRKYFLLGRDRMIARLAPPPGGRVLEIGCGTARNLVRAARAWPDADFFGIDISHEMLDTARQVVVRRGLTAHIQLAHGDATRFDPALLFGVPGFSRIFISYSLSMIPGWRTVLGQAAACLLPGGEIHIVDFGGQERLPRWFKAGLRRWLALFHVRPRDDLERELTDLAQRRGLSCSIERPYRGYAQHAVLGMAPLPGEHWAGHWQAP